MQMCQTHWLALRAAIAERGLYDEVAHSGAEVMERMREQEAGRSLGDPLMNAHNAILAHALDRHGIALMAPNEDGSDVCPICYEQAGHDANCTEEGCTFDVSVVWINGAADDEQRRFGAPA